MRRFNPNKQPLYTPTDGERAYAHALAKLALIEDQMDNNRENKDMIRTLSKEWGVWKNRATKHERGLGWKWAA